MLIRLVGLVMAAAYLVPAQTPPSPAAAQTPAPVRPRRVGGFVPGQHREPGDPVQIARGKTLYGINCAICHGADLRGGDMGGPNLLRSQVALNDQHGELITPIIHGSRQAEGMPAISVSTEDGLAVATFVRSVLETIGVQGTPPTAGQAPPSVIVGNAKEGAAYFAAKCSSCHSPTKDLQGIASKIPDAKDLQTAWVRGAVRGGRRPASDGSSARTVTVAIALPGERVEGELVHVDDFLVVARLADGTVRSFPRAGDGPRLEIRDPMKAHHEMLTQYSDRDIHDVTAFLATLK